MRNDYYHQPGDISTNSGGTVSSSQTYLRLNEYIHAELPSGNDSESTMISNMVSENHDSVRNDKPEENIAPFATPSYSDNGSVDLVYVEPQRRTPGTKNRSSRSWNYDQSKRRPLVSTKASSNGPYDAASSGRKAEFPLSRRSIDSAPSRKSKLKAKSALKPEVPLLSTKTAADISLDSLLERLSISKPEPVVCLPPKAAWESKLRYLSGQIDSVRESATKLTDIESLLERKKAKAKRDTEQAKWKSRVRDLEDLLEEKRKVKREKLRNLAGILKELKKERAAIKKYDEPNGSNTGDKWRAKHEKEKNIEAPQEEVYTKKNEKRRAKYEKVKEKNTESSQKEVKTKKKDKSRAKYEKEKYAETSLEEVKTKKSDNVRGRRRKKDKKSEYLESVPIRPSTPERSASLVRTVSPRKASTSTRRLRKSRNKSSQRL